MNQLTIKIDLEDYTAGLFVKINANGFSGFGEGWFNTSEIIGFCRELESLDSNSDGKCELVAGQSKSDGSEYIELIGIRCYVIANGLLGMHVSLTDYPYTDCRQHEISKVSSELKLNTQSAIEFAKNLHSLCLNEVKEVTVVGQA